LAIPLRNLMFAAAIVANSCDKCNLADSVK